MNNYKRYASTKLKPKLVFLNLHANNVVMSIEWVHNLDPFAIQFKGDFGIRWYGLAYLMGFLASYHIIKRVVSIGKSEIKALDVGDLITYMVLGVMIGGRFGYCLFYNPSLIVDFRSSIPFWGPLAVWEGGMSSHGGFLGIIIAAIIYAKKNGTTFRHVADLTIFGGCIGIILGRIANFINGELVGRVVEKSHPFIVKYPTEIYNWLSSANQAKWPNYKNGLLSLSEHASSFGTTPEKWKHLVEQAIYSASERNQLQSFFPKIINAIQNGNENLRMALAPYLEGRYPSQLYAAALEGLIPLTILGIFWIGPRKEGFIASLFLCIYAVLRVVNEQFRTPDAHLGFQLFDLTRGQWLSIAMFALSAVYLIWCIKTPGTLRGGWLKGNAKDS